MWTHDLCDTGALFRVPAENQPEAHKHWQRIGKMHEARWYYTTTKNTKTSSEPKKTQYFESLFKIIFYVCVFDSFL